MEKAWKNNILDRSNQLPNFVTMTLSLQLHDRGRLWFVRKQSSRRGALGAIHRWSGLVLHRVVSLATGLLDCVGSLSDIFELIFVELHDRRKPYRLRPRSPLSTAAPASAPGVSILRPLKGLDTNLYENLESTFNQEYPNYEIIFSVTDEDDQALPVVRDLLAKYRHFNAKVIIGTIRNAPRSQLHLRNLNPPR
jgi:hypothetical protein